MSIARAVGKGIAWNTFSTVLEKGIILGNVFLTLTYLTIHEYGLVQLILSALSLISVILLPGFSDAIVADLAVEHGRDDTGKVKEVLVQYTILVTILSLASWGLLFFGSSFVVHMTGGELASKYLRIISYVLLLAPARTLINMILSVKLKFREQAFYTAIEEVSKFFLLIVCLVWLKRGVEGVLIATVFSQLCATVIFFPYVLPYIIQILKTPAEKIGFFWRTLSPHRLWSIANSYIGTLVGNAQVWIIKAFLGTDAVALFTVAQGLVSHVVSLLPLNTVIIPVLPRYIDKAVEFRQVLRSSMKLQIVSALGLVIFGMIAGPAVVYLFFQKYIPSLSLYFILLLGIFASSANVLFTTVFLTLKRQKEYFSSSVVKLLLTVSVLGTTVYFFGIIGTAFGAVLVGVLSTYERHNRLARTAPEYRLSSQSFFTVDQQERLFMRSVLTTLKNKWLRVFR